MTITGTGYRSTYDPLGGETTYTYDILGRKLTETDARGNLRRSRLGFRVDLYHDAGRESSDSG